MQHLHGAHEFIHLFHLCNTWLETFIIRISKTSRMSLFWLIYCTTLAEIGLIWSFPIDSSSSLLNGHPILRMVRPWKRVLFFKVAPSGSLPILQQSSWVFLSILLKWSWFRLSPSSKHGLPSLEIFQDPCSKITWWLTCYWPWRQICLHDASLWTHLSPSG